MRSQDFIAEITANDGEVKRLIDSINKLDINIQALLVTKHPDQRDLYYKYKNMRRQAIKKLKKFGVDIAPSTQKELVAEINDDDELSISQRLENYFYKRGYRHLGEGRDQIAFLSPRNTVVKVLGIGDHEREKIVRDYVAHFERNQHNPYYPKIYNSGEFTLEDETYFIYEQEYLQYVANEEATLDYLEKLMSAMERDMTSEFISKNPLPSELDINEIDGLIATTEQLIQALGGQAPLDLSQVENLRRRESDGHLVIMDPYSL